MAAKFLHSLSDDTTDFQRQMGCMNGIFQLFDRQNMLTSRRRIYSSQGNPHLNVRNSETESTNASQLQSASLEKYSTKNIQERQKSCVGSSRGSLSCSSSFSSIDYTRASQMESTTSLQNSSTQNSDIRDFVKDSMYRELQGLKSKMVDNSHCSDLDSKQTTPSDVKKHLQILAQYQTEPRELFRSSSYRSKDAPSFVISQEPPRLSYDGRDDSSKSSVKLKISTYKSIQKEIDDVKVLQGQFQRQGTEAQRPSIIAKLMGLEAIPHSVSPIISTVGSARSYAEDESLNILRSSEEASSKKQVEFSGLFVNSCREPNSPNWRRNSDSPMKPATRISIEPAPWKHTDAVKSPRKQASKGIQRPVIPSVYGEIDKRLEDLEFLQSGKDLRALKQILGTMQAKVIPETVKERQRSVFFNDKDSEQNGLSCRRVPENRKPIDEEGMLFARRKTVSLQNNESQIVIMKPAKYVDKYDMLGVSLDNMTALPRYSNGESADSRKNLSRERTSSGNGGRAFQATETSVKSQQSKKDENMGCLKNSGSLRPRIMHKKTDSEKGSLSSVSLSSSRTRRQANQQRCELSSHSQRRRTSSSNSQQSDNQKSGTHTESTNLSTSELEDSAQSNETIVLSNCVNTEVTGSQVSTRISNLCTPNAKSSESIFSGFPEKELTVASSEEETAESAFVPPEFSSPVSVLDSGVHKPDTSPVKYVGKTLKVDACVVEDKNPNLIPPTRADSESTEPVEAFDSNRKKKLQNIENLVLKLRKLNSSHDESRTDYIALLCDNSNPDHRYISKILLASGILLRALTDYRFHSSGHPVNPELFLVLEQTKGCTAPHGPKVTTQLEKREKHHRKLVFDAVNEILAKKLSETTSRSLGFATKTMITSQVLLRDLCSEIDSLQAECSRDNEWKSLVNSDMMKTPLSERCVDYRTEISDAVIDIERMIFKDLVNEIIVVTAWR